MREVGAHELADDLGVKVLGEARGPGDIGEEQGDELALLLRRVLRGERGTAMRAEGEALRDVAAAARTGGHGASLRGAATPGRGLPRHWP